MNRFLSNLVYLVLGVNAGCDELPSIMARSFVNSYRLECMLGRETMRHDIKGRVTLKADFGEEPFIGILI